MSGPWWKTALVVLATWAVSALVQYGVIQQRLADHERRISILETYNGQAVTQAEFQRYSQELTRRLERLDAKFDAYFLGAR